MNSNRAQRRAQIRRTGSNKRRKDIALAGLSLAATTGLVGGSISYLRPIFAYASTTCSFNVTGGTLDSDIQSEITDAYNEGCSVLELTTATEVEIEIDSTLYLSSYTSATAFTFDSLNKVGTIIEFVATGHGLANGDLVQVTAAATTGLGVGTYEVTVVDANTFTIDSLSEDILDETNLVVYKIISFQLIADDARVTFVPALHFEGTLLQFSEGEFTLTNLGFENAAYEEGWQNGGAVSQWGYLSGNDFTNLTIEDSYFSSNLADGKGGAVFLGEGNLTVINSDFVDNESYYSGGAIYAENITRIEDSLFDSNFTEDDGGAIYTSGEIDTILRTDFEYNEAEDDGGAIEANGSIDLIEDSTFTGNISGDEGGAVYTDGSLTTIDGSTFIANVAYNDGGAIYVDTYLRNVIDSTFSYNETGERGGAIYVDGANPDSDWSIDVIEGSSFIGNSAAIEGGAVFAWNDISEITDSGFVGNGTFNASEISLTSVSKAAGQSLVVFTVTGHGLTDGDKVGVTVQADNGLNLGAYEVTRIDDDNFSIDSGFNTSLSEGGLTVRTLSTDSDAEGGAIYVEDIYLIEDSVFSNNTASEDGGAISADNGIAEISNSLFEYNYSGEDGGAISLYGELYVYDSSFIGNSAYESGGAINVWNAFEPSEIRNSTFYGNEAQDDGRAIRSYGSLLIQSSTIWHESDSLSGDGDVSVWDYDFAQYLRIVNSVIGNAEGSPGINSMGDREIEIDYSFISGGDSVGGFSSGDGNITGDGEGMFAGLVSSTDGDEHQPVLRPSSTSALLNAGDPDFVGFGEGALLDQRGLNRIVDGRIDIGAVELQDGEFEAEVQANPTYSGPIVVSASPRLVPPAGGTLVVAGEKLQQVTGIKIDGKEVNFTRLPDGRLSLTLPADLKPGKYTPVFTGSFGTLSAVDLFQVVLGATTPGTTPRSVTLNYTNFIGDRSVLTAAARNGISRALAGFKTIDKVVCIGSTSGTRVTAADRRLATARAKAACDLIKRLRPEVVVELKATPAMGVGARFRSVTLQISGS